MTALSWAFEAEQPEMNLNTRRSGYPWLPNPVTGLEHFRRQ
jgi:hypothetical protein